MYTHVYICIDISMHMYTHIYTYIYIYIVVSILFYLSIGSEEVLLYFSSCFWFTPETEKQDGNKFIILN